jgi:predicted permease
MPLLARTKSLLRTLFRRVHADRDLDEELRSYLALLTQEKIAAGLPPAEARRQALIDLGGLEQVKQSVRESRAGNVLDSVAQDVRYSFRNLRKTPVFAAATILTLALGIGANTAIFTLLNAVLFGGLHVHDPQHLVLLQWHGRNPPLFDEYSAFNDCVTNVSSSSDPSGCSFSSPVADALRQSGVFQGIAAFAGPMSLTMTSKFSPALNARGEIVSGDYFETLGVRAAVGRTLQPSDDTPASDNVAVLRYGYWQEKFASSPNAIGATIRLNNVPFTIIGVADPTFTTLAPGKIEDLWISRSAIVRVGAHLGWSRVNAPTNAWLAILARLKPGVSSQQAQAQVSLAYRNEITHGSPPLSTEKDSPSIVLISAQEGLTGERDLYRSPIYVLMLAVAIILLITCANVAGLLVARSSARQREIAVRFSLGAGRGRIARLLLTESLVIAFAGGALALLFANWGIRALGAFISSDPVQHFRFDLTPDARVFAFSAAASLVCGLLFSIGPILTGGRVGIALALKELSGHSAAANARFRWLQPGAGLVVIQIALAIVILSGAGLLVRTLGNIQKIDPGFETRNLLVFAVDPQAAGYDVPRTQAFYRDLDARLSALPGVLSVGYSSGGLLIGSLSNGHVSIVGAPDPPRKFNVDLLNVGPDFFETMRIPLVAGRTFKAADFQITSSGSALASSLTVPAKTSSAPIVSSSPAPIPAIVNRSFAEMYLAKQNPIGVRLTRGSAPQSSGQSSKPRLYEIVGVVGDTKFHDLRPDMKPAAYFPLNDGGAYFELRTALDPYSLAASVRSLVTALDPDLPLSTVTTEAEEFTHNFFRERLLARLATFFGALALLLACVGIYGLLSYEVSRRTREFGIRTAIGAQRRELATLVLGRSLRLSLLGIASGVCAALIATRYLESLLYGLRHNDATTFAAVAIILTATVLAASYVPARRAAKADPMVALRHE